MGELKTQNEKAVVRLMIIALVPFYLSAVVLHHENIMDLANSRAWQAFLGLTAISVGPIVCLHVILRLVANNVGPRWKERLAHLRWHHPLPGSRADALIRKDSRIDVSTLPPQVTALLNDSMSPHERNAYWYSTIFRKVRDTSAVSNTHRTYLLYREAAAGTFVLFWVTVSFDLIGRGAYGLPLMTLSAYVVSAVYLLLLIGAANQAGNRMVTGAIANFTLGQPQGDTE